MTYQRAEIRVLGDAVSAIQSLQKVPVFAYEFADMRFEFPGTNAAYDLDE